MNHNVADRVVRRVSFMQGLEDVTSEEVMKVYRGEDIDDTFKTVAITQELSEYGFPPHSKEG